MFSDALHFTMKTIDPDLNFYSQIHVDKLLKVVSI